MSYGDDRELFPLAAKLINNDEAKYLMINGSDGEAVKDPRPGAAWAGKDEYIRQLKENGVPMDKIILSKPALHTYQANIEYLKTAMEHDFKTAVTLNQPQQLLRATLGQICAMDRKKYWMRLYSTYSEPWEAARLVQGPQGDVKTPRFELLGKAEFDRIMTYQKNGDLASFEEFLAYIKKRPEIV
jgi:hypothetical protein